MLYSIAIEQKNALRLIYLTYMYSNFAQTFILGQKKSSLQAGRIEILVPKTGLEPTQLLHHQNLKLARLPIPPYPRVPAYIILTFDILQQEK